MFALSGCLLTGKFMKLLMIFEISTLMKIKIMGFWVTLVCSFLCGYRHCGVIALSILPTLKMAVRNLSEIQADPVSAGNMFQDLLRLLEAANNTKCYIQHDIHVPYINMVKFN
jgi:hypothetical protein